MRAKEFGNRLAPGQRVVAESASSFLFLPHSFSCFPFETRTSSMFLRWAAQLFCRRRTVAWFIRGYVHICNTVCRAAHVCAGLCVCVCVLGGIFRDCSEEQLWRNSQSGTRFPSAFLRCRQTTSHYYFFIFSRLFFFFFCGAVLFFVLSPLRIYQLYSVLEFGRIHDLVKNGLRTGNRRGMNG